MTEQEYLDHLYEKRSIYEQERNALSCQVAVVQRKINDLTIEISEQHKRVCDCQCHYMSAAERENVGAIICSNCEGKPCQKQ